MIATSTNIINRLIASYMPTKRLIATIMVLAEKLYSTQRNLLTPRSRSLLYFLLNTVAINRWKADDKNKNKITTYAKSSEIPTLADDDTKVSVFTSNDKKPPVSSYTSRHQCALRKV